MPREARQDIQIVGRDADLDLLRSELASAQRGDGGLVLIHGEPGIGKTALVQAFAREATRSGSRLLWGRGYDGAWLPPYAPWLEALNGLPDRTVPVDLTEFQQASDGGAAQELLESDESRFRLHAAIVERLRSDGPIVVVLDDAQWMDSGSIELLRHIAHFGLDMPLLIVVTYRDGGIDPVQPLAQAVAALQRAERVTFRQLSGLQPADVLDLLMLHRIADATIASAERITLATSGHPLFVAELMEYWKEQPATERILDSDAILFERLPVGIGDVVNARFERLSPTTLWVLRQVAIFSSGFDFAVLPHLTGLPETELLDVIDELLAAKMIEARADLGPERYDIVHAIVRLALVEPLSPSRRVRLERAAAEAMERAYGSGADLRAAELAMQYGRSASLPNAEAGLRYARIAADRARRGFDRAKVAFFLAIARDLVAMSAPDVRAPVLVDLAIAQADDVQIEESCATAESAIEALEQSGASPTAIATFYADLVTSLKQHASAAARVWRPLLDAGLAGSADERSVSWARLKLLIDPVQPIARDGIRSGSWVGFDAEAIAVARADGDERTIARTVESFDFRNRQQTDDLLQQARTWRDPATTMYGLTVVANDLQYRHGAFQEAEATWDEIAAMAARHGAINWQAQATNQLTILQLARGQFSEARESENRAVALLDLLGPGRRSGTLELEMETAFALFLGGDFASLGRKGQAVVADKSLGAHDPATLMSTHYAALAASCYAEAEDRRSAESVLGVLTTILEALSPFEPNQNGAVAFAGSAIWRLNLKSLAPRYLELARSLTQHGLGDYPQSSITLTTARMAALAGDEDETARSFSRARSMLDASGQRPLRALCDLDEATWLAMRGGGDRGEPRATAAMSAFEQLGMSWWHDRAAALLEELRGAGGEAGGLPAGLSEREAEVLRLVVRGMSDRQISDQLFVSPRTINSHVRHMLDKTGAVNRTELSVWAVANGLATRDS